MRKYAKYWLAAAVLLTAAAAGAQSASPNEASLQRRAAVEKEKAAQAELAAGRNAEAVKAAVQRLELQSRSGEGGVKGTLPPYATPVRNPYRTYAPSCVAYRLPDGLPLDASGPLYPSSDSLRMRLAAVETGNPNYVDEFVDIDIWRIPCSSSVVSNGQYRYDSVTLVRIKRDASNEGRLNRYPLFPAVYMSQQPFGNNLRVRVAEEPNTVREQITVDTPIIFTTTYVLENIATNANTTALFDFNNPFTITFDNLFNGASNRYGSISVPVYAPTQAQYPLRGGPIPITGYLTGNWYDEAHSGEGMLVQIFDLPGSPDKLLFTFAWFTFSNDGRAFWLFGSTPINHDERGPINVRTVWSSGGGFAGNFGPSAQVNDWGTVIFSFPNCYEMDFDYSSTVNVPGIPSGSGSKTWTRPANNNGLTCE